MIGDVVLETKRLYLRQWHKDDLPALQTILGDTVTMSHWPKPFDEAASAAWLRRALESVDAPLPGRLAIHLKDDDELIGDAGLMRADVNG